MLKKLYLAAFVSCTVVASAYADIKVGSFDANNDLLLSRSERENMRASLKVLGTSEASHWLFVLKNLEDQQNNQQYIPVAELEKSPYISRLDCNQDQRIFLRDSIDNLPFLHCQELWPKSNGASFSFTEDLDADTSRAEVDGVLGIALISPGSLEVAPRERRRGWVVSDFALLGFAEAQGTFNFGRPNRGYTRFGANAYAWTEGGSLFERVTYDASIYYQSDLRFGGEGYGVQAAVTPQQSRINLNSYVTQEGSDRKLFWVADGRADVLHIDNPGTNNLAPDTDYAWIGGRVGIVYEDKPDILENGFNLKINANYYWDLVNNVEAFLFSTSLDFNLNRAGSSSIGIDYDRGENRQDLNFEEKVTLSLRFKL